MKESSYLFKGQFGIERETLRVDKNGRLAQTPHPFDSDCLTRDFCENQLEIITPVCKSINEATESLSKLDREAREKLNVQGEYIWLYSNPPHIQDENDIPIAKFEGSLSNKRDYRLNLQRRYGKRLMLYSGIHFNFSFAEEFIHELYEKENSGSYQDFKDRLYFRLMKQALRYSWLIVLLTASSPVYDISFDEDNKSGAVLSKWSSMRSGERGYWNQFVPELDYSGIPEYIKSVDRYIRQGVLFSASELYLPVRLKPRGENSLKALLDYGADHIELRMFDLNPLEPLGISVKDLQFAHIFMVYLLSLDDFEFTPELQIQSIANHKAASLYNIDNVNIGGVNIKNAANKILDDIASYFGENHNIQGIISYERRKLNNERNCEKIKKCLEQKDYTQTIFKLGSDTNV